MQFAIEDEVLLTKAHGFEWLPGMAIRHVGWKLRIVWIEEHDFLDEQFCVLHCMGYMDNESVLVIPKNETFLDLDDPVTAAYCRLAISSRQWTLETQT